MEYKCVNCGREIKRVPGRFSLCECGHTEIVDAQIGAYIEADLDNMDFALMTCDGYIEYLQKENPENILEKIVGLSVKNGEEISKKILNRCSANEQLFLKELPTWAVIAHEIEKKHSKQYRYVISKKYYSFAYEVLKSGKFLNMPQPEALEKIDHLMDIWKAVPAGSALTVYEALLYHFSDKEACQLGCADISIDDFFALLKNTDFDREEIISIAYRLSQLLYEKKAIISLIEEYNWAIRLISHCETKWEVNIVSDMDTEICRTVNKAKYYVRSNMRLRVRLKDICQQSGPFSVEDKEIRMEIASLNDACRFCATVPEIGTIKDPAFVVYDKDSPAGILYIGQNDTYGIWFKPISDRVKRSVNNALDIYVQSDACKQIRDTINKSDKEIRL